ncbi:DEAD/DEAH box helicase family protein [Patescibacteria group bacterium AH-259-L07]|nr:DEAD/DEAH box helicase family protein [Patescibacteria group bacterium AH-259-L07]
MTKGERNQKIISRETDTRIIIDRKLREAGWDIEDKNQVSTEEPAKKGRADYLLKDRRGRPLAVIEAKRFSIDPEAGKHQALEYAKSFQTDFIFVSNGKDIYFWDYKSRSEQKVATLFSQKDLEKLLVLRKSKKPLSTISIPDKVFTQGETKDIRPYQREAIQAMDRAIEAGKRKMLMVMATGTGKTLNIAIQIKRMFEAGLIERVLFLVDRIELGKQAQDTFNDYLKEYPSELLYGGRQKRESSIIIGTLPTIYSQLRNFTSGYFDLVISDEAHRSIYHIYKAVLAHFNAIKIGLTATPSMYIDRNTYKLFNCWDEDNQKGIPTFVYGLRNGIKQGYLAGYDIVRIDTKVSLEGITYEGDDYNPEDLERVINVPARSKQIVKTYRNEEEKRQPHRHRKAIIFAITQKHAAQLAYYFNQLYPEFNGRYAEVITSNVPDAGQAIKRFKQEELPYVAVSVGMLDCGFDAPKVENIVMVRPTKSPILYQQMRGRGSRLCKGISKTSFRIYDFVGTTRDFNDESYNPYSEILEHRKGIPWGTELEELTAKEREVPENIKKVFVQVPEDAPENVDLVVKREYVEVGPEGEKIDTDDYQVRWKREIQLLVDADPLIKKIKAEKELTDEEVKELSGKLNSPEFYFNEANLRAAYHYPQGKLPEFVRDALNISELPTKEKLVKDKVDNLFEAWLLERDLKSQQAKILRMIKNQYLVNKEKPDISIFNKPLFGQFGGLRNILKIFGEKGIQNILQELNNKIFIYNHGRENY